MTRLGLYIALVVASLACAPWLNDSFGMVKVATAWLGIAIAWLAMPAPGRTQMDAPIALALAALAASAAVSVSPALSVSGFQSQPFHGLLALAAVPMVFYAAQQWREGPAQCCAVVAIASAVACAIELALPCLPPFHLLTGNRAVGTIGAPPFLGAVMAVCLPACVAMGGRLGRAGAACAIFAIMACGSRGPLLAAGAGLGAYLVALGAIRARWVVLGLSLALLALFGRSATSDAMRLETWAVALRGGLERPILGWGPDTFFVVNAARLPAGSATFQASAHNDLLQAWATTGALGLAAYAWLWWSALRAATPAVLGSLVALFVVAKFNPVPPPAFYLAAALLGAALPAGRQRAGVWAAGLAALLLAPGIAFRYLAADGRGTVQVRVR